VPSHHRFEQRFLPWSVNGLGVDVFHSPDFIPPLKAKGPLVITIHDLAFLIYPQFVTKDSAHYYGQIDRAVRRADAIIAVSEETRLDLHKHFDLDPHKIHVIHNGIDLDEYHRVEAPDVLRKHGVDPDQPYVLFVGRITRQKGIVHLVRAIQHLDPGFQVVLCAGAPDTVEIKEEMEAAVNAVSATRPGVVWIQSMLPAPEKIAMYSHAAVFCCPSIYEPFGIINLEAMACETAVVATAVGGIKEVVVEGETGFLIPIEQQTESPFEAVHPEKFARDLAAGINKLMADPALRQRMALAGRQRAVDHFSWHSIARKTLALYKTLAV
jgi:glycogen synthase